MKCYGPDSIEHILEDCPCFTVECGYCGTENEIDSEGITYCWRCEKLVRERDN